jgi:hypothetical protein
MRESRLFFAAAFFSAASLPIACAHTTGEIPAPTVQQTDRAPSRQATVRTTTTASDAASAPAAPTEAPVAADPYADAAPISARSIGHTSYVLKVTLEGGFAAAYKPGSTLPRGKHRYKGEIAAYRLARALGLDNVPLAMPRAFSASALRGVFPTPKGAADFDHKAIVDAAGFVHGALMPWIRDYRALPLEEGSWRARWESWLMNPATHVPDGQESLAASISTMLLFDYVTANWDRWSGGNMARAGDEGRLLFVDNDGAFYEHPAREPLAAQLTRIRRIVRFSRSFVASLHAVDDAKLRAAFGEETPGVPLLSDHVIADVEGRIATVLGIVDASINRQGDAGFD